MQVFSLYRQGTRSELSALQSHFQRVREGYQSLELVSLRMCSSVILVLIRSEKVSLGEPLWRGVRRELRKDLPSVNHAGNTASLSTLHISLHSLLRVIC